MYQRYHVGVWDEDYVSDLELTSPPLIYRFLSLLNYCEGAFFILGVS